MVDPGLVGHVGHRHHGSGQPQPHQQGHRDRGGQGAPTHAAKPLILQQPDGSGLRPSACRLSAATCPGCGHGTRGGAYGDAGAAVAGARDGRAPLCGAGVLLAQRPRAIRSHGDVAVHLAPAAAAQPGHPEHGERGHDDRRRQPPQDVHAVIVPVPRRTRATGQGAPTHSSSPSLNIWCFQIGTSALSRSIRAREAVNASPRCAAESATTTAASPIGERAGAVHGGEAEDGVLARRRSRRPPGAARGRSGARSTPARSRRGHRRGRGPGRRRGSARPRRRRRARRAPRRRRAGSRGVSTRRTTVELGHGRERSPHQSASNLVP